MDIKTVRDLTKALREGPYTSIGSYPIFFITSDGGALSYKTVKRNFKQIAQAVRDKSRDGWRVVAADINWEDHDLRDDDSGEKIESAY